MPRPCTVCLHAARQEIDAAVLRGDPLRQLASRFGLDRNALGRHRDKHIPETLARAAEARREAHEVVHGSALLGQLNADASALRRIAREAEEKGDRRNAISAYRAASGCTETLAKVDGRIQSAATVNVNLHAGRERIQRTILAALEPFPDARHAVARALMELDTNAV